MISLVNILHQKVFSPPCDTNDECCWDVVADMWNGVGGAEGAMNSVKMGP